MIRLITSLLLSVIFLTSCDKIRKSLGTSGRGGSIADQIRISSQSKPEIVTAFKAISAATHEHNRVFLQSIDDNNPSNELAYSAGLTHLDNSARNCAGLAKQIINAVAVTRVYEKGLFVPFDKMRQQIKAIANQPRINPAAGRHVLRTGR
jgi:hypothetical protein